MSFSEEWLSLQGTRVRVMHGGEGEALLFLHGGGGVGHWLPFYAKLAEHFHVYVPEHPGFGRSDDPEWLEETTDLALFYKDFVNHYGWEQVHLVGHSLGGWLGAEFAVFFTERVKSLTLIDAAGIHVEGVSIGDNFLWHPDEAARKLIYNPQMAEERVQRVLTEEEVAIDVKNRTTLAKLVWSPRWYSPALEKRLHRITAPTLIIWGREDNLFPVQHAYSYQGRIPGANLEVIPECGHSPHVEKPEEVAAMVVRFCSSGS